jgi:hypothetical protein
MIQNTTNVTDSVRISKDIFEKIKIISKLKGQTISGYVNVNLSKQVDKDWFKFQNKHEKKNSI